MKKVVLIAAATGRDHMIAKHFSMQSEVELSVIIWTESKFIRKLCTGEYHVVDLNDIQQVCDIIKKIKPDFVIPGQGDILQHGLTNILNESNILCIGPTKELAQIEGSKTFMRTFMEKIDASLNPMHQDFFKFSNAVLKFINSFDSDIVIKCDHVISGPRVRIFKRDSELDNAINDAKLWIKEYGHIIIEEFITGEEIALTTYTDGSNFLHTPFTKNYKRVFEKNVGENTSGMGSVTGYNCFDTLPKTIYSEIRNLNEIVLNELNKLTKYKYIGPIYGEFIVSKTGLKVIEYNCRFGNPCSLNIFSLMNFSIVELFEALAYKNIHLLENVFNNNISVSAYVVPEGYTLNEKNVGNEVDFQNINENTYYYGNMLFKDQKYFLKNSRAFAVCEIGGSIEEARNKVYNELRKVEGNIHYRKDIGI
ncbi:hypothetical protein D0T84_16075 [Dysgonomonas sp. 521]|uniref:phosphoribosylglycinamide synthetase C domain-containing protein n=1 Tax=Dysgonomonas sp. 521 TaxID=2302932 RepID=UPI0013D6E8B5|nr:phosphoribosylglycinamide synthetase C domain-containing protein [Dysgonomonas sp. 521]NDV96419.1 hypothetical protein [Dysgonomonas sp. 521]